MSWWRQLDQFRIRKREWAGGKQEGGLTCFPKTYSKTWNLGARVSSSNQKITVKWKSWRHIRFERLGLNLRKQFHFKIIEKLTKILSEVLPIALRCHETVTIVQFVGSSRAFWWPVSLAMAHEQRACLLPGSVRPFRTPRSPWSGITTRTLFALARWDVSGN